VDHGDQVGGGPQEGPPLRRFLPSGGLLFKHVVCWVPGEDELAFEAPIETPLCQAEGVQQVQVFKLMYGLIVEDLIEGVGVILLFTLMNWEGLRSSNG